MSAAPIPVRLDPETVASPEAPVRAVQRRLSGRYPVDPFGLDPQLADLAFPFMAAAVPIRVEGAEHVPTTGPATIVVSFTSTAPVEKTVTLAPGQRTTLDVALAASGELAEGAAALLQAGFARVDYVAIRDAETLAAVRDVTRPARVLSAARVGTTRLIDNMAV